MVSKEEASNEAARIALQQVLRDDSFLMPCKRKTNFEDSARVAHERRVKNFFEHPIPINNHTTLYLFEGQVYEAKITLSGKGIIESSATLLGIYRLNATHAHVTLSFNYT